jgi:hypothetical protein
MVMQYACLLRNTLTRLRIGLVRLSLNEDTLIILQNSDPHEVQQFQKA